MDNAIKKRAFELSVNGIKWKRKLRADFPEIGSQVLKSLTSIGANLAEAEKSESRKDWIHKIQVALKEAQESLFWLELINEEIESCDDQIKSLNYLIGTLVNITNRSKNKLRNGT